jgi:hypothetical protein
VIPGRIYARNTRLFQPREFGYQKPLGPKTKPLTVEQIAGNQDDVNSFINRTIDGPAERRAQRRSQSLANLSGAAPEGGVQVRIGEVQQLHHYRVVRPRFVVII